MKNKKAVHPVVAIALLLIVSVTAVVSFQTWIITFTSTTFSNAENNQINTETGIKSLVGNKLYFNVGNTQGLYIISVKIDNTDCGISGSQTVGMKNLSVGPCKPTNPKNAEIVVVTDNGVFSKYFYIK